MEWPKISIVTPSYNQAVYIEATIQSVLEQNYPNLEYIVIDGGSTDGSVEIIKKYEDQLAFWVSEPDEGMYFAIQKGFDRSTGEIMAWINSDDMYYSGALFVVAEIFSRFHEVNWLIGNPSFYDESGRTISVSKFRQYSKFDFYSLDYVWIQQESTFWRRPLWERAGSKLNLQMKYAADSELWLRFFRFEKLYATEALIGGFRYRSSNQISLNKLDEYIEEAKSKITKEPLVTSDKIKLNLYLILSKFIYLISLVKIFNTNGLKSGIKKILFKYPKRILFNTSRQQFEML